MIDIERNHLYILFPAALATLHGVSDEYHQPFVAARSSSNVDVLVYGVGAITAAGALRLISRSTSGRVPPPFPVEAGRREGVAPTKPAPR